MHTCTVTHGFPDTVLCLTVSLWSIIGFVLRISGLQTGVGVSLACRPDRAQRAPAGHDRISADDFGSASSFDLDGLWTNAGVKCGYVKMCFEERTGRT